MTFFKLSASEVRKRCNAKSRKLLALQSRSFSVNIESVVNASSSATSSIVIEKGPNGTPSPLLGSLQTPRIGGRILSTAPRMASNELNCQSIDINVIQPTPNISPSASLKSFDEACEDAEQAEELKAGQQAGTGQMAAVPVSAGAPFESNQNNTVSKTACDHPLRGKSGRRVSFSEEEVTSICSDPTGESAPLLTHPLTSNATVTPMTPPTSAGSSKQPSQPNQPKERRGSRAGSLATSMRQMTVPMAGNASMTYLQVRSLCTTKGCEMSADLSAERKAGLVALSAKKCYKPTISSIDDNLADKS